MCSIPPNAWEIQDLIIQLSSKMDTLNDMKLKRKALLPKFERKAFVDNLYYSIHPQKNSLLGKPVLED